MIKESSVIYNYYQNENDIPEDEKTLIKKALQARENAYARYSDFMVGAAILMEDGTIVTGNNQENAAYPSGLCAERVTIYHAGAMYPNMKMLKLAVVGGMRGCDVDTPVAPCGACRQAILEYSQKQGAPIEIIFAGTKTAPAIKVDDIEDLLPFCFGKDFLQK
ncbi:MAG: cytidine deaminase [Flavobacteriales bacterium]|nr:cytidine deaminase [Flavobacteriales bacterium]